MSKIRKISGFPEWLPPQKLFEDSIISAIKRVYELYGYVPLETSAVELISTLAAKGTVDKEIYSLRRIHADAGDEDELALHFDLTVPFARYVAQNFNELAFPFKRYQVQKVWRGERPQRGRYREFYQFDIDMVARDDLPVSCDAEVLTAFQRALSHLPLPRYEIRFNNRKILHGLYQSLGLDAAAQQTAIGLVDKKDKIGMDALRAELKSVLGLGDDAVGRIATWAGVRVPAQEAGRVLKEIAVSDELFERGRAEVERTVELVSDAAKPALYFDLGLARGLNYYTGLIFETVMLDHPEFGSIGGGGRYENLASEFTTQRLPGVGASIGLSRILGFIFEKNLAELSRATPTRVVVTVLDEAARPRCNEIAEAVRSAGIACEVFYKAPKLGKQIEYAEQRGARYVLFLGSEGKLEVKDLETKQQRPVEKLEDWVREIQ